MATRRNVKSEKSEDIPSEPAPPVPSARTKAGKVEEKRLNPGPVIPRDVLAKLFGFTLAMLFAPISCYYLSTNYLFPGSTVLGASIAAVVANVVLIGFIVVAMNEEDPHDKKTQ